MMKTLIRILLLTILFALSISTSYAQSVGDYRSVGSGNWSNVATWEAWNGTTWVAATDYPGQNSGTGAVTIQNGTTVTIDVTPANHISTLSVGQGTSGILQYDDVSARSLTVDGIVTIRSGAQFRSAATGSTSTITTHSLVVGVSLINQGTIDFSATAGAGGSTLNASGAGITFTGAGSALFDCSVATSTNLKKTNGVVLNKGTSASNVLSFTPGGIFQVLSGNTDGFLTITNGTFKILGTNTFSNPVFSLASYIIPATGGFELSNANATILGQNGSIDNDGTLRITAGTYNIGTSLGNSSVTNNNGTFELTGGVMNIAGRFELSNATANITGGTLNIATIGHSDSTKAAFSCSLTSNLTISGNPLITFAHPNSNATPYNDIEILNGSGAKSITGGTFQMGTAATTAGSTFLVSSQIPLNNLTVYDSNSTVSLTGDLTMQNNLTVNGQLLLNGKNLTLTNLSPDVTLNFTGGTFTSGATVTVNGISGKHPNNANTNNYLNRYWTITTSGITSPVYDVTITYAIGDVVGAESKLVFGTYTSALPWIKGGVANTSTHTLTANSLTGAVVSVTGISGDLPTVVITNGSAATICSGSSLSLNTTPTGDTPYSYSWTSTPSGFSSTNANPSVSPLVAIDYTVTLTDGNGFTASDVITVNVDPLPTASAGGNQTICSNGTATVSGASSSNGTISWTENGAGSISSGATTLAPTYTAAAGDAGNTVTLTMTVTSNNTCGTATATATYTVHVDALPSAPTVTNQTICYNTSATLTAGGAVSGQVYKWYDAATNGNLLKTSIDFNDKTFTTSALTASASYWVTVTISSTGCESSRSKVDLTVQGLIDPGAVSGGETICYGGNPAAFTSTTAGSGGLGTLSYQWESSVDASTWTSIATNGTSATYDPPAPLNGTTYYRRRTIYTYNSIVCSSVTNQLTVFVQQQITGGTISADQTICEGDTPATLTGDAIIPGLGAVITYQWQSSPSNSAPWTNITGATSQNYQPAALSNDLYFRRVIISTLNANQCTATSNSVHITVNNVDPGTILNYQEICFGGTPATITSTTLASGDGTITYKWQSGTESATGAFTDIVPAVSTATYTPPSPLVPTWYRRVAVSTLNGTTCSKYITHELFVGIYDPGTITASDASLNYCSGSNPGIINGTNQTGAYSGYISFDSYRWQYSTTDASSGFIDITSSNLQNYDPSAITVTTWYRRIVKVKLQGGSFCESPGNVVQMNVFPVPVLQNIPTVTACEGNPYTISATASNTGTGTPVFKLKYISGTYPVGSEPADQTNNTGVFTLPPLSPPLDQLVGQQNFEVTVTNGDAGACPATKTAIVKIYSTPSISVTTYCASNNDGRVVIDATLNNANFSGADVGTLQYTFDNGATWGTSNTKTGLATGNYSVGARNSASTGCFAIVSVSVVSKTVDTQDYSICQNGSVPSGQGLVASALCYETTTSDPTGTTSMSFYNRSTLQNSYVAGPAEYYYAVSFIATESSYEFKLTAASSTWSMTLYNYPFNIASPANNFIKMVYDVRPNDKTTFTPLIIGHYYTIVISSLTAKDYKLHASQSMQYITPGTVKWYTAPSGGTSIASGSPFNPVGVANSGITNTNTPGEWIFYAGCTNPNGTENDCRQPAIFKINATPIGVATKDTICTGATTNIQLVSKDNLGNVIDPTTVTYTWTASVTNGGSATGFSNCTTGCGTTIAQTISSTNVNICPIIRYVVTPKVGTCSGASFNVDVLVLNNNLISLDPSTPQPAATVSYSCIADVPAATPLKGIHACLGNLTSTVVDTNNGGTGCSSDPLIITRTWTFKIVCGDVSYQQVITVQDITPPTFTVPADMTIYSNSLCSYDASISVTGDVTDEADNCVPPSNFQAQYTDNVSDGACLGSKIITRTWTLSDKCGNTTSHVQTITVLDNIKPAINCNVPQPLSIKADAGKTYATYTLPNPTYSDNSEKCNPTGTVSLTWVMVNGGTTTNGTTPPSQFAVGTNNITYTATDPCGNSNSCSFIVTVEANDPPVVVCPPATLALNTDPGVCTAEATPALPTLTSGTQPITWTWGITGPGSLVPDATGTFTGSVASPGPPSIGNYTFKQGVSTINWRAENIAGFAECSQTVTVTDATPPTFTLPATEVSYCVSDIKSAVYNPAANLSITPLYDDLTTPRPEYYEFIKGSTVFNLDTIINNFNDNCCASKNLVIHWKIDFSPTPDPSTVAHNPITQAPIPDQTDQPSLYPGNILFPGDGVTFLGVVHKLTYWLIDCHGNKSAEKSVNITIKPRPDMTKIP